MKSASGAGDAAPSGKGTPGGHRLTRWKRHRARKRYAAFALLFWAAIVAYNLRWLRLDGKSLAASVEQKYAAELQQASELVERDRSRSPRPLPLGPFINVRVKVNSLAKVQSGLRGVERYKFSREIAWDSLALWTLAYLFLAILIRYAWELALGHIGSSPFERLSSPSLGAGFPQAAVPGFDPIPLHSPARTAVVVGAADKSMEPGGAQGGDNKLPTPGGTPGAPANPAQPAGGPDGALAPTGEPAVPDRTSFLSAYLIADVHSAQRRAHQLDQRSWLFLLTGLALAVIGIIIYFLVVQDVQTATTTPEMVMRGVRSFGLLIFIEGIAFFLLRQHRALLQEHRSFYSLYLKRMNHLVALGLIPPGDTDSALRTLVVTALLQDTPSERLAQGETTPSDAAFTAGESSPLTTALKAMGDRLGSVDAK